MTQRQRRRGVARLVAAVLVVAGCSSTTAAPATTTDPPTTTTAQTSTTATSTSTTTTSTTSTSTTTTTTSTTATSTTTVPATSAPATEGRPSDEEVINIVNTWGERVQRLYADPTAYEVDSICAPESDCAELFQAQIEDLRDRGERVEGAEPVTVAYLRSVSALAPVGFTVSFWTNPSTGGTLIGPERTLAIDDSLEGDGSTLAFLPFPQDPELPWRVAIYVPDET